MMIRRNGTEEGRKEGRKDGWIEGKGKGFKLNFYSKACA